MNEWHSNNEQVCFQGISILRTIDEGKEELWNRKFSLYFAFLLRTWLTYQYQDRKF